MCHYGDVLNSPKLLLTTFLEHGIPDQIFRLPNQPYTREPRQEMANMIGLMGFIHLEGKAWV